MAGGHVVALLVMSGAAAVLAGAGVVTARRAAGSTNAAMRVHAAFWWAGSGVLALAAAPTGLHLLGVTEVAPYLVVAHFTTLFICVALACLLHYAMLLAWGRSSPAAIATFYGAAFAMGAYVQTALAPWTLVVSPYDARLVPTVPFEGPLSAVGGLFFLPVVLALAAYVVVAVRARDRPQRYRAAVLMVAFVGWVSAVGATVVMGSMDARAYLLPTAVAAAAVGLAYVPPPRLARWMERGRDAALEKR